MNAPQPSPFGYQVSLIPRTLKHPPILHLWIHLAFPLLALALLHSMSRRRKPQRVVRGFVGRHRRPPCLLHSVVLGRRRFEMAPKGQGINSPMVIGKKAIHSCGYGTTLCMLSFTDGAAASLSVGVGTASELVLEVAVAASCEPGTFQSYWS